MAQIPSTYILFDENSLRNLTVTLNSLTDKTDYAESSKPILKDKYETQKYSALKIGKLQCVAN